MTRVVESKMAQLGIMVVYCLRNAVNECGVKGGGGDGTALAKIVGERS